MKSKLATFIISVIMILIIFLLGIFGYIIWQEVTGNIKEPENLVTQIATNDTLKENLVTPNIKTNSLDEMMAANNESIDNTRIEINKHFYNQLSEESKIIYEAFEKNKENMKSGTYTVEFGDEFSDILSKSNGQNLLGDYYQSAIEAYTYDNPDVFYLSPNKMYLNIETTTRGTKVTYNVFMNQGSGN